MWRSPTLADIGATLSRKELDAYRQSSDFDGADPVEALLSRTAAMVRAHCRANGTVPLSSGAGEIPESLVSAAMDYAAFDILKRLPVGVGEDRRRAREQAVALFERVANRKVAIEPPDGEEAALAGPAISVPERTLD